MPRNFLRKSKIFQSTRSAGSATKGPGWFAEGDAISIHALRRERDELSELIDDLREISIHALRRERDGCGQL